MMDKDHKCIRTEVIEDDLANAVKDKYGVLYSRDGKRLLGYKKSIWNIFRKPLKHYYIKEGTTIVCNNAFKGCKKLTAITISNSVNSIGNEAFAYCQNLTEVNFNAIACTSAGSASYYSAFHGCDNISTFNFGDNVTIIPDYLCHGLTGLTSVIIPNSVITIGDSAFGFCRFEQMTIPYGVISIGSSAFEFCWRLKDVSISSSVAIIKNQPFKECESLNNIKIAEDNPNFCMLDGVIYSKDIKVIVQFPSNLTVKSYKIPSSITEIRPFAFNNCKNLTEIIIPGSVKVIGQEAFAGCLGLKEISIPSGAYSIGIFAFGGCEGATELKIPDSVTTIVSGLFCHCKGLKSINIPESVTTIGERAFAYCSGLTKVNIPNSVTSMGRGSFADCVNLTQVTISNNVKTISHDSFRGCSSLNGITIPESVTMIGTGAFCECTGLTEITIPNSVTQISDSAFSGCTGLAKIKIPTSVTKIGNSAFSECKNLKYIIFDNPRPPSCSLIAFDDGTILSVPKGSKNEYLKVCRWHNSQNIIEYSPYSPLNKSYEKRISRVERLRIKYAERKTQINEEHTVVKEQPAIISHPADKKTALWTNNRDIENKHIIKVDYSIPSDIQDKDNWTYPVVKYPSFGCIVFPYRQGRIARMGYMEPFFREYLQKVFLGYGLQILGDRSILPIDGQRPYEPDIAIIPDGYPSIKIDVEIDEPYAALTNKPTHYIGCGDDFRDMELNNLGWIVIRFTEHQVKSNMEGCAAFIAQKLHRVKSTIKLPHHLLIHPIPHEVRRWKEVEANQMAVEEFRQKYLGHEFGETQERQYIIEDITQTEEEKEIASKVPPLNIQRPNGTPNGTPQVTLRPTVALPTGQRQPQVTNSPNRPLVIPTSDRDNYIQFYPYEHIYLFNGREQFKPVSKLVSYFFAPFDASMMAEIYVRNYGGTEGKILEEWDRTGHKASEVGTFMHQQIENSYNGRVYQEEYSFKYDGKFIHEDSKISLKKEHQHFVNFQKDHDFKPYKTEWAIYDEGLKIAGTIDMLHKRGEVFDIYDWKRSGKIVDEKGTPVKNGFRGKSGINGLECVQDTAYWHYCIQQNLYRYILEKNYGITVGKMYLVVMIATMDNYIKLEVPRMNEAIEVIVEKCREGFIKLQDSVLPF